MTKNFTLFMLSSLALSTTANAQLHHGANAYVEMHSTTPDCTGICTPMQAEQLGTLLAKLNHMKLMNPKLYNAFIGKIAQGTDLAGLATVDADAKSFHVTMAAVFGGAGALGAKSALRGAPAGRILSGFGIGIAAASLGSLALLEHNDNASLEKLTPGDIQRKSELATHYLSSALNLSAERKVELKNKIETEIRMKNLKKQNPDLKSLLNEKEKADLQQIMIVAGDIDQALAQAKSS